MRHNIYIIQEQDTKMAEITLLTKTFKMMLGKLCSRSTKTALELFYTQLFIRQISQQKHQKVIKDAVIFVFLTR